jgi:hypothetical protein
VIGRLVEQQQVRLLEQESAERDTAHLATRERRDVRVRRRHPERVHGNLHRAVEIPRIGCLDGVLDTRLFLQHLLHRVGVERLAEARVDLVEPCEERSRPRHALLHIAAHVLARIEPRLLGEVSDPGTLGWPRFAQEVLIHPRHDAQQRALSGAVRAEDADLRAGKEREPDALQDLALGRNDLA